MSTAAKNRNQTQGRDTWCATFRHPLRTDADKKALRVRRGLGTKDGAEADRLVAQLNEILADKSFWTPGARDRALKKFDPRVVDIFYDAAEAHLIDGWSIRNTAIQLPGPSDGYVRIQPVGTTGAGKTTAGRQLLGTDPRTERFPSTSTAKTTIFDIEVIADPSATSYRAVASFLPQDQVRELIEECVVAATSAAATGEPDRIIARKFLEHGQQRFRLSYLLGSVLSDQDEDESDGTPSGDWQSETVEVSPDERTQLAKRLEGYLAQIAAIAEPAFSRVATALGLSLSALEEKDREAFNDLLEGDIAENEATKQLVDEIADDIESRFELLAEGTLVRDRSGWPQSWAVEIEDRSAFISTVNRLSSNYAPNFGKLLAPVVDGLRVRGPFRPKWLPAGEEFRFVLLDGEGLGHTNATISSLSTRVTARFDLADVIMLVDNAQQPMQAASQLVLRTTAANGHDRKLVVAFTHFDQVQGPNIPTVPDRKAHVRASLDAATDAIDDVLGAGVGRRIRRRIQDKTFFLSSIQNDIDVGNNLSLKQLRAFVATCREAIRPRPKLSAFPVYDLAHLALAVQRATEQFHEDWNRKLGLVTAPGVVPEHWGRVKALSRRLGNQWVDEYDNLRPVADLLRFVSERIAKVIASPLSWRPDSATEAERDAAIEAVTQETSRRLQKHVHDCLFRERASDWLAAFKEQGPGSTKRRARDIRSLYETAAPVPTEVPTRETTKLLDDLRDLFRNAAEATGAMIG